MFIAETINQTVASNATIIAQNVINAINSVLNKPTSGKEKKNKIFH